MDKRCIFCGGIIKNKRNKKLCSYKCAGLYRQNYAVCPVCGKTFKHSPSDTTTHTCGSAECKRKYRSMNTPPESAERMYSKIKSSPRTGHFETHHGASHWHIISPCGEEYIFKNLVLWAENNENLLPISPRTKVRVQPKTFVREIIRLKSENSKGNYHGWKIINNPKEHINDD